MIIVRRMLPLLVFVLALVLPAGASANAVIDDWADNNQIDGTYSNAALDAALAEISPADLQYTNFAELVAAAKAANAANTNQTPGGPKTGGDTTPDTPPESAATGSVTVPGVAGGKKTSKTCRQLAAAKQASTDAASTSSSSAKETAAAKQAAKACAAAASTPDATEVDPSTDVSEADLAGTARAGSKSNRDDDGGSSAMWVVLGIVLLLAIPTVYGLWRSRKGGRGRDMEADEA